MTAFVDRRWPQPEDLCRDPVLAILAALDAMITLTIHALIAAHPYAQDDERPYWVEPPLSASDCIASDVVTSARGLSEILDAYRDAIVFDHRSAPADDHQGIFPF